MVGAAPSTEEVVIWLPGSPSCEDGTDDHQRVQAALNYLEHPDH